MTLRIQTKTLRRHKPTKNIKTTLLQSKPLIFLQTNKKLLKQIKIKYHLKVQQTWYRIFSIKTMKSFSKKQLKMITNRSHKLKKCLKCSINNNYNQKKYKQYIKKIVFHQPYHSKVQSNHFRSVFNKSLLCKILIELLIKVFTNNLSSKKCHSKSKAR